MSRAFEDGAGKADSLLRNLREDGDRIDTKTAQLHGRLAPPPDSPRGRSPARQGGTVFGSPEWFDSLDPLRGTDGGVGAALRESLSEDWGWVRLRGDGGGRRPRRAQGTLERSPGAAAVPPPQLSPGTATQPRERSPSPVLRRRSVAAAEFSAAYYGATLHDSSGTPIGPDKLPPGPEVPPIQHSREWQHSTVPPQGNGPAALHRNTTPARPRPTYGAPRRKADLYWSRYNHKGYSAEQQAYLEVHCDMARRGETPTRAGFTQDVLAAQREAARGDTDRLRGSSGVRDWDTAQAQQALRAVARSTSPRLCAERRSAAAHSQADSPEGSQSARSPVAPPPLPPSPQRAASAYRQSGLPTKPGTHARHRGVEPVMDLHTRPAKYFSGDGPAQGRARSAPPALIAAALRRLEPSAAAVWGAKAAEAEDPGRSPHEHRPVVTRRTGLWTAVPCTAAERRHAGTAYRTPRAVAAVRGCAEPTPRSRFMYL